MHGSSTYYLSTEPQALPIGWAMGCLWRWNFMTVTIHGSILGQNLGLELHCQRKIRNWFVSQWGFKTRRFSQFLFFVLVIKCTPPRMALELRCGWACAMVWHHPFHGVNLFSNRITICTLQWYQVGFQIDTCHAKQRLAHSARKKNSIVSYADLIEIW